MGLSVARCYGRDAEVDGGLVAGAPVDLGEFVLGSGEADLESFDFSEPAFVFGFGYAGEEIVSDLDQAGSLFGGCPEE
jgi:hypothetical protein